MKAKTIFIILSVLGVGGIAVWFFSQKSDKHLKLIPKDAIFVGTADWAGLAKKADFEKIKESEFYKKLESEAQNEEPEGYRQFREMMNNPESTGINVFSDIYFYVTNLENVTYTGMAVAIKDVKRFEQMLMRVENNLHIQVGYNCHYVPLSSQAVMAWDENSAFVAYADSYRLEDNWQRMFAEWSFGQLEEQTMKTHAIFKDLMDQDRDVRAFFNGPSILQTLRREFRSEAGMITKNMAFLEDNYMLLGLDFEDDAVVLDMTMNVQNEAFKQVVEIGADGISDAHMNLLGNNAITVGAFAFHMDKMMAYLMQFSDVKKELDKALQELGMSQEEFASAFSGELSFSWNGFLPEPPAPRELSFDELMQLSPEDYDAYQQSIWASRGGPMPDFAIHFSSSNKDAVRKLMAKTMEKSEDVRQENGDYILGYGGLYSGRQEFRMIENPIGFSIANNPVRYDALRSGNVGQPSSEIRDFMAGKTTAVFYNFEVASAADSSGKTILDYAGVDEYEKQSLAIMRNATFYAEMEKAEVRMNLRKGPDNSLNELIMHLGNSYLQAQKKMEEMRNQWELESQDAPADELMVSPEVEAYP